MKLLHFQNNGMTKVLFSTLFCSFIYHVTSFSQNIPILGYSINNIGQVQLEIDGDSDSYYILTALHEPALMSESFTSMTMGVDGPMIISEPLQAYQIQNYKITAYPIANPGDIDQDGIDDITEFNNMPSMAPLNFADEVPFIDGTTSLPNEETFSDLAVVDEDIPWAPFLNGQQFAKFAILNQNTDKPEVYFINSETHSIHAGFLSTIDITGAEITTGEIVYNPNTILPNGVIGAYSFNYSFGDAYNFQYTQRTFELLSANMPFLRNNFIHFIGSGDEEAHQNQYADDFIGSRIRVVLESDFFSDVDYIPMHQAEGYGFFRQMTLSENPGSRDIVLYDALPNSLPRVGGIITSVIQTPLSHVNLRAIQDDVPNAYIKNPLEIDSISNLLNNYIYYKVDQEGYTIREATLQEVEDWYEKLRPTETQTPDRDLTQKKILPLDSITFDMANSFGAKCSNVATMRTFGFPDGTIPNGFGIPFYFYDEFMKFNDFYSVVEDMLEDEDFVNDLETRIDMLDDLRDDIKDADMPQWMLDELQAMHDAFPEGTAVRCRSSTNNEDLPGFSGAGLYTSKTQHLDEGHISKSVKQVFASMWNFRAFEERDFYRVDHFVAAMGILCHPNFEEEKSNGVGISIDPIFNTNNTFYLNTQVGESLITNPDPNTIPEEILLNRDVDEGYFVLRYSNLVGLNELIMDEEYLNQMRDYLQIIHDEFAILYDVVGADGFGMDIEYKVTAEDQLIIKQARPWVSFWSEIKSTHDLAVVELIEPKSSSTLGEFEFVTVEVGNEGLEDMIDFELILTIDGQVMESMQVEDTIQPFSTKNYQFTIPQDFSSIKDYSVQVVVENALDGYTRNDTLNSILRKLHLLEGNLEITGIQVGCGEEIRLIANVMNLGEATFENTEIEVVSNGVSVDTVAYEFNIPSFVEVSIPITVSKNLMPTDNTIELNLLAVNGFEDAVQDNNSSTIVASLDSEYDFISLLINSDMYPEETSWELRDDMTGEIVSFGSLSTLDDETLITEDVCVNYKSCYTLFFYDSIGDGICCGFGEGDFSILDSTGDILVSNNGDFGSIAEEFFCLDVGECTLTAEFTTTNASDEMASDGTLIIVPDLGLSPYEFSIDGGMNFSSHGEFDNLVPGVYEVVVRDLTKECTYEKTIEVGFGTTVGVSNISLQTIKVFPNPSHDIMVISFEGFESNVSYADVRVVNSLGQLIERKKVKLSNSNIELVVSDYLPGTYNLNISLDGKEHNIKVLKL